MAFKIDPKQHTAIATVVGTVKSVKLHEGEGRNGKYSLLRVQVEVGSDQVAAMITASQNQPSKAQQASEQIRQGDSVFLRGFLMEEEYQGRLQWTVNVFAWGPANKAPSAVFYVVGELQELNVAENGIQDCYMVCRRVHPDTAEIREEYLTVRVWPQFDTNEFSGRTVLIRGRIINRVMEDEYGVELERKAGLAAEIIQIFDVATDDWSKQAKRTAQDSSALPYAPPPPAAAPPGPAPAAARSSAADDVPF